MKEQMRMWLALACALAAAQVACAEDQGATAPEFIWRDLPSVVWRTHGNARVEGDMLVCEADATNRNAFAWAEVDLSAYDGKPFQMHVSASAEGVTASRRSYLGFRFQLSYLDLDMGGNRVWPGGPKLLGTQPMQEILFRDINPKRRGKAELQLGLHDCTGRAVYNLKTLQVRATPPLVPKVNAGYKVKYPDSVRKAPLLRGVMLGNMNGEEPWQTLKSWGATLVRHQISLGGAGPATNHAVYIKGYRANFEKRLAELERNLAQARKYGMKVCIDQHSSPGGRCDAGDPAEWRGDCRMFHDPVYAQLFIDCWVELVRRMAPWRDAIYGYDLINEACHNSPALPDGDIFNLQRRCAETIRAVDPDTPIVIESMHCDPGWFAQLSALRMDNVIYQVHLYYPHDYTHQGILTPPERVERWPDPKKGWNREFLRKSLKPVIDFQREHDAKMFVGEFSAIAWAPNAEGYIRDCISLFEELGWDWTYHAFREFDGWSVEREAVSRGMASSNFRPSRDNPRMCVLKQGLRGELAPDGITLPGEDKSTREPVSCAPFPDRMSAYVWRNWFLVPHDRLASVVGAAEADLEGIAAEMGLPAKVDVLPAWRRQGYITVLRRNWHLLDYPQLLTLLDMTRRELYFSLTEDDFLWHKLGQVKPLCGRLAWDASAVAAGSARRRQIAAILREEGIDDFSEEPRFSFVEELKRVDGRPASAKSSSPFDLRLIFSYFANYGDPLGDPEIGSYPEGLLEKLAAQGVNAVWLHTVLNTLAKDPKYPEFGEGCEKRMANLRKLVARAAKYGIKVYLYMNEPRAQPPAFFEANEERRALKGVSQKGDDTFTMCTSQPETLRWMRDAVKSVFAAVPGLGGIFTISMSENLTNCASRGGKAGCPRCRDRSIAEIVAEVNRTLIEGMKAGNPNAEALVWNWAWPDDQEDGIMARLPKEGCRLMAVSEGKMDICRGGVKVRTHDYSISCVGPSEKARSFWAAARAHGFRTTAKVQANTTWEIASVPYLPVMDLVAEHASNLVKAGVDGVMLSWSLGCLPAPNLRVYNEIDASGDVGKVLDAIARDLYGKEAVQPVRKAWHSFSDGFRNFPFDIGVVYFAPFQMGCANPLYRKPTGYRPTMVGIPYDGIRSWCGPYPPDVWVALMQKVADGFERGCVDWKAAIAAMGDGGKRAFAEKEYGIFRTAALHFASVADQVRFVQARDAGDGAAMAAIAARELARAKEELGLARADSRIGYESSNHYFFVPQDLREKILTCRIAR